jgi:hypothetical protein
MKKFLLIISLIIIAGCNSQARLEKKLEQKRYVALKKEEIIQEKTDMRCENLGYKKDTKAFYKCKEEQNKMEQRSLIKKLVGR